MGWTETGKMSILFFQTYSFSAKEVLPEKAMQNFFKIYLFCIKLICRSLLGNAKISNYIILFFGKCTETFIVVKLSEKNSAKYFSNTNYLADFRKLKSFGFSEGGCFIVLSPDRMGLFSPFLRIFPYF